MSALEEEAQQSLNIGKGCKLFLIFLDAANFKRKKSSFKKWTSCLDSFGAAEGVLVRIMEHCPSCLCLWAVKEQGKYLALQKKLILLGSAFCMLISGIKMANHAVRCL